MKPSALRVLLCLVTFWVAAIGVAQADLIVGSLPMAGISVSIDGVTLNNAAILSDANSITSGTGTGDFSGIPIQVTDFGGFTLTTSTLSTGGGFSISNATYGSFVASSGAITPPVTANFLNVDLFGTFTPGPAFPGDTPSPARVHLSFTQTDQSVSASMTLATVPEPRTMLLFGSAVLGLAGLLRHKRMV